MANYVYIATSLDGYIADVDGGIEWLKEIAPPKDDDLGFSAFLAKVDAIVIGRITYTVLLAFARWPYDTVFVISNTLLKIQESLKDKASLIKGSPQQIVNTLLLKGYRNLYIDGATTIQSFLKYNLIDEIIFTVIPKILGQGISLFTKDLIPCNFQAYKTELLSVHAAKTYFKKVVTNVS